ncbi:MAG TPA: DUF3043 domain-containing protein [Candidatus Luteococcus avicola]|nr:DUF3043 domain-containing protein [Candidatus Luteococcus avicola]
MGLFRPYEQGSKDESKVGGATAAPAQKASDKAKAAPVTPKAAPAVETVEETASTNNPQKKGRPTPTRAEAEAARMARLHPVLTPKQQKKADRAAAQDQRLRSLDAAERSPERQLARDYIDSRLSLVSLVLPAMLVLMAISISFPRNVQVTQWVTAATMLLFALFVLSIWLAWRGYQREARVRGLEPKQRGLMMYLMNRMMTMRFMRRPEPRVTRGEKY